MDKLSILMKREAYEEWAKSHPLGAPVAVTVDGVALDGTVAEFAEYHGRFEVRIRLKQASAQQTEKGAS